MQMFLNGLENEVLFENKVKKILSKIKFQISLKLDFALNLVMDVAALANDEYVSLKLVPVLGCFIKPVVCISKQFYLCK